LKRFIVLERVARPHPSLGDILRGVRGHHFADAVVSFLFACTGPVALILTVGIAGGLKPAEIASWISIAFGIGGPLTFAMSYLYRQPLAMAWTISGSAIVGAALLKFPYDEIVGAYVVTGVLMFLLGLSGGFRKLMDFMPQPIVMAMVAGLFLKFALLAIDGFDKAPIIATAAAAGFVLFSVIKPIGRVIPPVVAALIAGGIAIAVVGGFQPRPGAGGIFADPIFFTPKFTEAALLDLVLPLAISVLVLQNAQGIAILRMNSHDPPSNTITAVCGAGTVVFGLFGAVCTCLTGPVNAILSAQGDAKNHYIGALLWAFLAVLFGLFAPAITTVALAVPDAFIYVIGGLAMLRVLQQSMTAAFGGKFAAGAMVCFAVTITELIPEARFALLGIGAPFWGLVFGILTSLLLETGDFRRASAAIFAKPAPLPAPPPVTALPPASVADASSMDPAASDKVERPIPPVPAWALEAEPNPSLPAPETPQALPPPEGPVPARAIAAAAEADEKAKEANDKPAPDSPPEIAALVEPEKSTAEGDDARAELPSDTSTGSRPVAEPTKTVEMAKEAEPESKPDQAAAIGTAVATDTRPYAKVGVADTEAKLVIESIAVLRPREEPLDLGTPLPPEKPETGTEKSSPKKKTAAKTMPPPRDEN